MGHVVCHRDVSGTPHLEDVTSLDAALERVEQLRNGDGAEDVRLFEEVHLEVRTYYRVAVAGRATRPPPAVPETADITGREPVLDVASDVAPQTSGGTPPPPMRSGELLDAPPGVFPLAAAAAAPVAVVEVGEDGAEQDGPRRASRFGRER